MDKRYAKESLTCLCTVLLSPLILIGVVIGGIFTLCELPKLKKEYKSSRYYADLKHKFRMSVVGSPRYRFYNSAVRRGLPFRYVVQASNGLEYFIYNDILFLFPDFEELRIDDGKGRWRAMCDGAPKDYERYFDWLAARLDIKPDYPVKLLVERKMIPIASIKDLALPETVCVTAGYEKAFSEDDKPFDVVIPQDTAELYELMRQMPELCGEYELTDDQKTIEWTIDNTRRDICVDYRECRIDEFLLSEDGKIKKALPHRHPELTEILDEVCRIGKP